jgi:hypothetical protein
MRLAIKWEKVEGKEQLFVWGEWTYFVHHEAWSFRKIMRTEREPAKGVLTPFLCHGALSVVAEEG